MIKILIVGIGGVGGYFGGLLARQYARSTQISINFLARGEHLKAIKDRGLKVIKGEKFFFAKPHLATTNPVDVGIVDYVILCTKNYDLENVLRDLSPCVGAHTVFVPLLNGVAAAEEIKIKFPAHLVANGCAYIVSAIEAPGVIMNMGNRQEIYFGIENQSDSRLSELENLFKAAQVDAALVTNIASVIWEKFIFLSCIATATSYFNKSVGNLLKENNEFLVNLIGEVSAIANAKGISIDKNIQQKALLHYSMLPYDATSSMHRDYLNKKPKTELDSLTGYVIREADYLQINVPHFTMSYKELLKR